VELSSLNLNQLADVKQQLEQEVEHLTDSFQKLRQAQLKFKECSTTVDEVSSEKNLNKPLLVPLTSSLYVPGKISDIEKFMVDVGTGYYVEKVYID
jgi:prefoldin alpha subunit